MRALADEDPDFDEIKEFIPPGIASFLDIGPGQGTQAALIHKMTGADIHILDGAEKKAGKRMGYTDEEIEPWFDVNDTARSISANTGANVHTYLPGDDLPAVDLYLSLHSWSFHYPLEVYYERLLAVCRPRVGLIIDLRKRRLHTGAARRTLEKRFKLIADDIGRDRKCERTVWQRR